VPRPRATALLQEEAAASEAEVDSVAAEVADSEPMVEVAEVDLEEAMAAAAAEEEEDSVVDLEVDSEEVSEEDMVEAVVVDSEEAALSFKSTSTFMYHLQNLISRDHPDLLDHCLLHRNITK
jgi:hypothetical protein